MKTHQPIARTSIEAAAALSAGLFVGMDGDICGANAKALGVEELDAALGDQATVIFSGIALVTSGAAITQGAKVASDANGKAVVFSTGEYNGWAIDAATGANEKIRVLLV